LGGGLAGDLLEGLEVDAVLADFFGRDQLRRAVVVLAELADTGVISLLGAGLDGQQLQVVGEGIEDCVRRRFFICIALSLMLTVDRSPRLVDWAAVNHSDRPYACRKPPN
jgi:hypothetical protein